MIENAPSLVHRDLITERLQLRAPILTDAARVFATYSQDPEVSRYLTWRPATRLEETEKAIASILARMTRGELLSWVIELRESKVLLGMIELRPEANGFSASVGYVLARSAWGSGYMTEALKAVLDFAFESLRLYRVWALHDIDNVASGRVMEKSGMQREGILRRAVLHPNVSAEPRDAVLYARIRS